MSTLTVLVLLLGYRTSLAGPMAAAGAPSAYTAGVTAADTGSAGAGTATTSGTGTTGRSGSGTSSSHTVAGSVVATRYGRVQVQLTVSGGSITGAQVLQYPSGDPRSAQISDYALPVLVRETVDQQSAQVDMVSGATYTSAGYQQSLQSALDRTGL